MTEIKTPRGHYLSERKGLIKLSSMNLYHLKRALIKRQKDILKDVYNPDDTSGEFLSKIRNVSKDKIVNALKREIKKR
jgi:hypothetical protein